MAAVSELVKDIRETCMRKGVRGILGLASVFRRMDADFSQTVAFEEFASGLADYGVTGISREDLKRVFTSFDKDSSGTIDFREFVNALRPPLPPCRVALINEAFNKLDANKDGVLQVEDLKGKFPKKIFRMIHQHSTKHIEMDYSVLHT